MSETAQNPIHARSPFLTPTPSLPCSLASLAARRLAENGVIVARLGAIEEMAGMNMLCSDKTGTLTQNKLKLFEPIVVDPALSAKDIILYAALAAKRMEEGQDAIDLCVTNANNTDAAYAKKIENYSELEVSEQSDAMRSEAKRVASSNKKMR